MITAQKLVRRRVKTEFFLFHRKFSSESFLYTGNMSPELKESVARINVDDLTMLAYMPNRDDFEKVKFVDNNKKDRDSR